MLMATCELLLIDRVTSIGVRRWLHCIATRSHLSRRKRPQKRPQAFTIAANYWKNGSFRGPTSVPWAQGIAGLARRSVATAGSNPLVQTYFAETDRWLTVYQ